MDAARRVEEERQQDCAPPAEAVADEADDDRADRARDRSHRDEQSQSSLHREKGCDSILTRLDDCPGDNAITAVAFQPIIATDAALFVVTSMLVRRTEEIVREIAYSIEERKYEPVVLTEKTALDVFKNYQRTEHMCLCSFGHGRLFVDQRLQEHISGNGRACSQLQLGDRARWCLGDVRDIGQLRIGFARVLQ